MQAEAAPDIDYAHIEQAPRSFRSSPDLAEARGPLVVKIGRLKAANIDEWTAIEEQRETSSVTLTASDPVAEGLQPRTERGRRLLEIRKRIVASGARLLSMDEISAILDESRRSHQR